MDKLKYGFHKVQGRSHGRITSYHKGGGNKSLYRFVDFFRFLPNVQGRILKIFPDRYRTAKLCLVGYTNGILSYCLLSSKLGVGDYVYSDWSGKNYDLHKSGVSCPLLFVKANTVVHNVELVTFGGGQLARSAGAKVVLLKKFKKTGLLRLPSGKLILVSLQNLCTIGEVGFSEHKYSKIGKAGTNRNRGKRPHVRGQAMNPVDHPHGGRTNGGKVPCTPWGRVAKGVKTSRSKLSKKVNFVYYN